MLSNMHLLDFLINTFWSTEEYSQPMIQGFQPDDFEPTRQWYYTHQIFIDLAQEASAFARKTHQKTGFGRHFAKLMSNHTRKQLYWLLEGAEKQGCKLVGDMMKVGLHYAYWSGGQPALKQFSYILSDSFALAYGTESQILVGTAGNQPAWMYLSKPLQDVKDIRQVCMMLVSNVSDSMEIISQKDVWMIPSMQESADARETVAMADRYPRGSTCAILEDAYYNMRYSVNPSGAFVKLNGHPEFHSVTIKVKQSLYDPNFYDIFGLFDTVKGKTLVILDSQTGLAPYIDDEHDMFSAISGRPNEQDVFHQIIAQVFHDLVTAKEIRIGNPMARRDAETLSKAKPEAEETDKWIYIPRVIKQNVEPVRQTVQTGRNVEPHRVEGYIRRGNLTEKHRKELVEFEQDTDLLVLKYLPEGMTFVRPHISPKLENGELSRIPKFIKVRLQRDLIKLITHPRDNIAQEEK